MHVITFYGGLIFLQTKSFSFKILIMSIKDPLKIIDIYCSTF